MAESGIEIINHDSRLMDIEKRKVWAKFDRI